MNVKGNIELIQIFNEMLTKGKIEGQLRMTRNIFHYSKFKFKHKTQL